MSSDNLIVLYETWTSKYSNVELSGFSKPIHSFKTNKNILMIKLDKQFFCTQNDRFIAAAYIPPENSPIHDIYYADLFQQLKADINQYSQFAEIYVFGDLNSRVGRKNDFIENDIILTEFENNSVCNDVHLRRLSMDSG